MKSDEWLRFFKQHKDKKLFSLSDLSQLTEEDKSSLSVQLTRLVKAGLVKRVAYRWYENPFAHPTLEEISMILRYPSYLSMEYALSRQEILSQAVYTLTLITTKLPYTYKTEDATYEYHQIHKTLFWGYKMEGSVNVAEPEKAFLDLIYIRYAKNRNVGTAMLKSLLDDMDVDEIDLEKLHAYSKRFPPKTRKILRETIGWSSKL